MTLPPPEHDLCLQRYDGIRPRPFDGVIPKSLSAQGYADSATARSGPHSQKNGMFAIKTPRNDLCILATRYSYSSQQSLQDLHDSGAVSVLTVPVTALPPQPLSDKSHPNHAVTPSTPRTTQQHSISGVFPEPVLTPLTAAYHSLTVDTTANHGLLKRGGR